ncbi:hypothetical protein BDD14_3342 [Edaphobacter modestus]|uniref:Uncharacterized protein n=1 Tax=Edaphobacter modestus TaxID=388466 RepID=A0A4Q7YXI2_9BACT|nr:hypothetical protein BDD14_3342 [Edaphobacter modestus]
MLTGAIVGQGLIRIEDESGHHLAAGLLLWRFSASSSSLELPTLSRDSQMLP